MGDYFRKKMQEIRAKQMKLKQDVIIEHQAKKLKTDMNDTSTLDAVFIRNNYQSQDDLPKSVLLKFCHKNKMATPKYETRNLEKLFQATVQLNGKKYASRRW